MQIAVIGSWDENINLSIRETAFEVGRLIAKRGDILLTGGSLGVMEAAMAGAKSVNGITVGFIPGESAKAYPYLGRYIDINIITGACEAAKIVPLVLSADGLIAIAGGAGTLMEISIAYSQAKPIVVIPVEGYISQRLDAILEEGYLDHRKTIKIHISDSPGEAVEKLYLYMGKNKTRRA